LLFGNWVIRILTALKLGQPIRQASEVHRLADLHGVKQGTPTMGGILIIGTVFISSFLWARPDNRFVWLALFTMLCLGGLGFADDYLKVTKQTHGGFEGRTRLLIEALIAAAACYALASLGRPVLAIPGNHDIPHSFPARFTHPFRGFERQWETTEPTYSSARLHVIGLNSVRPWRHQSGGIRSGQLERAEERLRRGAPDAFHVVVLHHHLIGAPWRSRKKPVARRNHVLGSLVAAGADLILAGHIHQAAVSERHEFEIVHGSLPTSRHEIALETRSLMQILIDLGSYIEVPDVDVSEGRVYALTRTPDELRMFPPLLRIHSGASSSGQAYLAVRYREHWFWIDDRDVHSKLAFNFLLLAFFLTETGSEQAAPIEPLDDMDSQAGAGARIASDDGDVDHVGFAERQRPHRGSTVVAHDDPVSAREDRRHLPRERRRHRVPDQVDASVHGMQPARGEPVGDGAASESGACELRPRHDAVLPGGDPRDSPVTRLLDLHNSRLGAA